MMMEIDDNVMMDADMPDLPEFDMLAGVDGDALVNEESSSKVLEEWRESPLMEDVVDEIMQMDVQLGTHDLLDDKIFFNDPSICLSPTSALDDLAFCPMPLDEKELTLFDYPGEAEVQEPPRPNIHPGIPTPPPSMPFSASGTFYSKPISKPTPRATAATNKAGSKAKPPALATVNRNKPKAKPKKQASPPKPGPSAVKSPAAAHAAAQAYAQYYPPPHHPGYPHYPPHPHYDYSKYPPPTHYKYPNHYSRNPGAPKAPKKAVSSKKQQASPKKPSVAPVPSSAAAAAVAASTAALTVKLPVSKASPVTPEPSPVTKVTRTLPSKSVSAAAPRTPRSSSPSAKPSSVSAPTSPSSSSKTTSAATKADVGSYEEHYRQMRKLSESMTRSQESRQCFHMKTDKTEKYDRENALKVLNSIEQSTQQLQHYLCGGHTLPQPNYSSYYPASSKKSSCTSKTAAAPSKPAAAATGSQAQQQQERKK